MHITPEQQRIAQHAFATIAPVADIVAVLFYSRLFELDPSLQELFQRSVSDQGHDLMLMLRLSIAALGQPNDLVRPLHHLGARHITYGAQPHHYATVRVALLWAMQHSLGPAYTPDVAAALTAVFQLFMDVMQGSNPGAT